MLIVDNITCTRGGKTLFSHLGFCLQEGSLLLLRGQNGSGKTSLLKILAGLLASDSGQVSWNGTQVRSPKDFGHDLMVIGHENDLKPKQSVEKNLTATAKLYDTELLVPAALTFYDLLQFKDVPVQELSVGWQRKAMLARLIVAPCKLWLLDEPTNFLDDDSMALTASLIESRVTQGGIVVAASHIMQSEVATHSLLLEDFQ